VPAIAQIIRVWSVTAAGRAVGRGLRPRPRPSTAWQTGECRACAAAGPVRLAVISSLPGGKRLLHEFLQLRAPRTGLAYVVAVSAISVAAAQVHLGNVLHRVNTVLIRWHWYSDRSLPIRSD
jgi:hypothetical protein